MPQESRALPSFGSYRLVLERELVLERVLTRNRCTVAQASIEALTH